MRFDPVVQAPKLGLVGRKDNLVLLGLAAKRLVAGRPNATGPQIAQIAELSPAVAGAVLAPTRHIQAAADAAARAGVGQHPAVLNTGQQAPTPVPVVARAQTPPPQPTAVL